jgi:hypothetical protein
MFYAKKAYIYFVSLSVLRASFFRKLMKLVSKVGCIESTWIEWIVASQFSIYNPSHELHTNAVYTNMWTGNTTSSTRFHVRVYSYISFKGRVQLRKPVGVYGLVFKRGYLICFLRQIDVIYYYLTLYPSY